MRTAFIGYGAVSSVFMAHAWLSKVKFELITRTGTKLALQVELADRTCKFTPVVHPIADASLFDLLIVCIKAHQVADFIEQVRPYIKPNTTLVFINNGMGVKELVANRLVDCSVILGTTSLAALKTAPTHIKQTGEGKTDVGWVNALRPMYSKTLLNQCLVNPVWHKDINHPLWLKLAANAVINPITAYTNQKNGVILSQENQPIANSLCEEIASVMSVLGYSTDSKELLDVVNKIARKTKDNYSSMNRDIHFNRKTEIEFINGYICQLARENKLAVPINTLWYQRIKSLENDNLC